MIYEVYKQKPKGANVPQLNRWEYVCETESDIGPADYDWNNIVKALTGESLEMQSAKGIWWQVRQK